MTASDFSGYKQQLLGIFLFAARLQLQKDAKKM